MAYQTENLRPTSINGVKMYTGISQNRSLSTWFDPKKRRALRKDKDYMQRVELIQDMRFETATSRIKATPDGEYFIASGIYPPQVKVYECSQLALKFERHLVSEIINFEVLSDDYSKMAFLCADRSVCLHAKYGSHYSLRIPRMGRDIEYDCWSCDLICAASSPELYRINLEQGRFVSPLNTKSPAVNVVSRSEVHGLVACGGEDGAVECFDMRVKSSAGRIHTDDNQVTAIEFDCDGGYYMAVGSGSGKVLIYDLRASKPFQEKDHMYSSPILSIKWHKSPNYERPKLITTDEHIVKIWDPESGEIMTSIEPTAGRINDLCISKGSGLIFLALDGSQIPYYFIPALGPAPKWCSSLENLTEELEEKAETTRYVDFTFLTKDDLVKLNLENLIGTDVLKPCMHGFLMDCKLYQKVKAVANPFAYESYREQKKQLKIEEERASRITIKKKLPKVNRRLAAQLHENEVTENEKREAEGADSNKKAKKKKGLTTDVMKDERFAAMFEDKEFEIDEFSEEYLALHPILATTKQPSLINEHFEPIMEDDDQSDVDVSTASQSSEDEDADDKTISKKRSRMPRLYEVKDERHAEAYWKNVSLAKLDSLSLGERVAALRNKQQTENGSTDDTVKIGPGGSREISFTRRSSAKYAEDEDDREEIMPHKKRGIQSLKLKPDRSGFQGGGGRWRGGRGGDRGRGRGGGRGRGRGSRGRGGRF